LAIDQDVTLDAEIVTTAFTNNCRSFHFLAEPIVRVTREAAGMRLCLLHFLTPDRAALIASNSSELASGPIVISHVSDDKHQLEASKASTLYSGGTLTTGRDVYHAVCNFRCFSSVIVDDFAKPLVLVTLLDYLDLLIQPQGKAWLGLHRFNLNVAVHIFQDVQHIIHAFILVAKSSVLRAAVKAGTPIAPANYRQAETISRAVIARLQSIIHGNSLGEFFHAPVCASWFQPKLTRERSPAKPPSQQQGKSTPAVTPEAKRLKPNQDQTQADNERKMASGMLLYDPQSGGTPKLPDCDATDVNGERFCMQFLTQRYYCIRRNCRYTHLVSLAKLPDKNRQELVAWVKRHPGVSWAPGKSPPGTNAHSGR
jgi:hypothetical protein